MGGGGRDGEAMRSERGFERGRKSRYREAMRKERVMNEGGKKKQKWRGHESRKGVERGWKKKCKGPNFQKHDEEGGRYLRQESAAGLTGSPHITGRRDPS